MQMHQIRKQTMTPRRHFMNVSTRLALAVALAGSATVALAQKPPVTLLNVSYDPTRELYVEYNAAFAQLVALESARRSLHELAVGSL